MLVQETEKEKNIFLTLIILTMEIEIEKATKKLEENELEITKQVSKLNNKILLFTSCAWIFVVLGFIVAFYGVCCFFKQNTITTGFSLNLIGDYLAGTVTSLWSLAGLFFIYVAFLGQKQQLLNQQLELKYSQLEVKYTRYELKGQKKEMIEQNKTLKQQRFENTFFNLLTLHHQIVESMDVDQATLIKMGNQFAPMGVFKGRDVFKQTYTAMLLKIYDSDDFCTHYLEKYIYVQSDFGHYFRNLYRMIKLVDETEFVPKNDLGIDDITYEKNNYSEKYKYTSIIRSQLSDYELLWLFYNCLSSNGNEKFKPLIEKYTLFKNIPKDKFHDKPIISEYIDTAFNKVK